MTYSLNRLQRIDSEREYCVTLNPSFPIQASQTIAKIQYRHPIYDESALAAQARLHEINGTDRIFFCGSYFGYGFHEDAHRSGLEVATQLGGTPP